MLMSLQGEETQGNTQEVGHVTTRAEIGVMRSPAKEDQELPPTPQSWERQEGPFPTASRGSVALVTP